MTGENQHIIQKVNAELTLSGRNQVNGQSKHLKQSVQNAVERLGPIMDRLAGNTHYRIDTLSVDIQLDDSDLSLVEEKLTLALRDKIEKIIMEEKLKSNGESTYDTHADFSEEQRHKELLINFLKTGRLPWWAKSSDLYEAEEWLKKLLPGNWNAFIKPLINQNRKVINRMTAQMPARTLEILIQKTAAAQKGGEELMNYTDVILQFAQREGLTNRKGYKLNTNIRKLLLNELLSANDRGEIIRKIIQSVFKMADEKKRDQMIKKWMDWLKTSDSVNKDLIRQTEELIPEALSGSEILSSEPSEKTSEDIEFIESGDSMTVFNAGVVILHPFMSTLFRNLGYVTDGRFKDRETRERTVCILHFLATGSNEFPEQELMIPKFLCGWPLDEPVNRFLQLSEYEVGECESVLNSAVQHWKALKNTSAEALRKNFLHREGILKKEEFGWTLYIENMTHDILLDQLPWSLSVIKFKWMDRMLSIQWN